MCVKEENKEPYECVQCSQCCVLLKCTSLTPQGQRPETKASFMLRAWNQPHHELWNQAIFYAKERRTLEKDDKIEVFIEMFMVIKRQQLLS